MGYFFSPSPLNLWVPDWHSQSTELPEGDLLTRRHIYNHKGTRQPFLLIPHHGFWGYHLFRSEELATCFWGLSFLTRQVPSPAELGHTNLAAYNVFLTLTAAWLRSWYVCVPMCVFPSLTLEALVTTMHIKINQTSQACVAVCLTRRSGYQAFALIK